MLELIGIPAVARKRAGGYSMGMRQRLGLAAALLGDPRVLLLDEPANGLDPEGIRWLRGFLRHLSSQGKTILVSSHLLQEVEQTVDDVVIIANGRCVAAGLDARRCTASTPSSSDHRRRAGRRPGRPPACRGTVPSPTTLTARRPTSPGRRRGAAGRACRSTSCGRTTPDLEELFFELTEAPENRNRNLARWHPAAPADATRSRPRERSEPDRRRQPEFRKFFTTRLWWGMAIGVFVAAPAAGLFAALDGSSSRRRGAPGRRRTRLDPTQTAPNVYTAGLSVGYLLMLTIGVIDDRLGVPPQDDHQHVPGHPPAGAGDGAPRSWRCWASAPCTAWSPGRLRRRRRHHAGPARACRRSPRPTRSCAPWR